MLSGKSGFLRENCIMVDESSRPRRNVREMLRTYCWWEAWQACASEEWRQYLLQLVESFLKVIRKDFRGNEELSDVDAFLVGPSPHEDWMAEDIFVDDLRGGVLEPERVKEARQEDVKWWRGMGVLGAHPSKKHGGRRNQGSVSLRRIDTDKGDAGLTKPQVSIGRERSRRPSRKPRFFLQLHSPAECLYSSLCSSLTVKRT